MKQTDRSSSLEQISGSSQVASTLMPDVTGRNSSEVSELQRKQQGSLLPKLLTQLVSDRTRANRARKKDSTLDSQSSNEVYSTINADLNGTGFGQPRNSGIALRVSASLKPQNSFQTYETESNYGNTVITPIYQSKSTEQSISGSKKHRTSSKEPKKQTLSPIEL